MQSFEQLGAFYLGRGFDAETQADKEDLLLYDSKDLTTHALCVGMTCSGKTGLCLAVLEEAAIDGIPAIAIDPKGDLGNLMLSFPKLRPEDFKPWIDPAAAARTGATLDEFAAKTAGVWKEGIAGWGQSPERIERYRSAVDVAIYTPGSRIGLPLAVLKSFDAPSSAILNNPDALRERVMAAVSGLLALLGIEADPLRSREHILLSNLLERAWRAGRNLSLAALIREIQTPPFDKLGFMDLESVFAAKDRFGLAMALNNLLASPGFSAWAEGEPLDIQRLLYTPEGKPKLSILSIAHLSDSERMFFVTILLNEVVSWMRAQQGTSSLRALLYMDEVFGYFPPTANPPSKMPMLTLLKQARAFGLGVMLATQNPVDLDYKGLSNCGTWFLGRLQTERDKARVLDGLEGASSTQGRTFDRAQTERILSGLGSRVFLMNNVHDDHPQIFKVRWLLNYMAGPLSREQISRVMAERKGEGAAAATEPAESTASPAATSSSPGDARPLLPPGIAEAFLPRRGNAPAGASLVYRPGLLGTAKLHFAQSASGVDVWQSAVVIVGAVEAAGDSAWDNAEVSTDGEPDVEQAPEATASFMMLPAELATAKPFGALTTHLKNFLFRTRTTNIFKCKALKQASNPGESEGDFRARLSNLAREERDLQVEKLAQKYKPKLAGLEEQLRKAGQRVEREKSQASNQTLQTVLSIGNSVLGAMFGRKLASATNVTRATSSVRSGLKIAKERQEVGQAEETVEAIAQRMANLNAEFEAESARIQSAISAEGVELEEVRVPLKKGDIAVGSVVLLWTPWWRGSDGSMSKAFEL